MPTYEFRCPDGHDFEKFYRTISGAESTATCPQCGKPAERVMSATGFSFKGSGFYLTDYGKNAHREKGPADARSGTASGEPASGDSASAPASEKSTSSGNGAAPSGTGSSSGEAKPSAAKPETKPAAAPAKKSAGE
jgi:putative FmdB family regulatory protein